jgi:hypothetical protein
MIPKPYAVPLNIVGVPSGEKGGVRLLASGAACHDAMPLEPWAASHPAGAGSAVSQSIRPVRRSSSHRVFHGPGLRGG